MYNLGKNNLHKLTLSLVSCYHQQNRRQKILNRGALRFCGGALGLSGGAWHSKNWQKLNCFKCFGFQFGGLRTLFGGVKPPKAPRGDGTDHQQSETNISSCDVIANYLWCNLPVWCSCRTVLASTMVCVARQYVKPAVSLMLVICIPTITEHLVVAAQPHHFNSQSVNDSICKNLFSHWSSRSPVFMNWLHLIPNQP